MIHGNRHRLETGGFNKFPTRSHDSTCRSHPTSQHDHRSHYTTHQHFQDASKKRRMRQHFKRCSGRMHKLKGCSTRPCRNPFLPRQLLQPHIHLLILKSILKWMLAHYEEHQLSIQKTTPTHQDRQPTHVTSASFKQSHRTTYFT